MIWAYRLHFVFLVALVASVALLAWLARVHDRG
jgi:hypothetical protein